MSGRAVGIIAVDLSLSGLGLASLAGRFVRDRSVLAHTVSRLRRVAGLDEVVVVHPAGQAVAGLVEEGTRCVEADFHDPGRMMRAAARLWASRSWRGGLGGMSIYDELPLAPVLAAARAVGASSVVLAGGDWPLLLPEVTRDVLAIHRQAPEAMKLTFSQAPPGLAGVALHLSLLEQLVEHGGTIGGSLAYHPRHPQGDPIGKEVCAPIPHTLRDLRERFVYDLPDSVRLIDRLLHALPPDADTPTLTAAAAMEIDRHTPALPGQVTLDIMGETPMDPHRARELIDELSQRPDALLTFNGRGDPLAHEAFDELVHYAKSRGVMGIAAWTEFRIDEPRIEQVMALPLDVVVVNLYADTPGLYREMTGHDAYERMLRRLEYASAVRGQGRPWLVPRMIKTPRTLVDMDRFFDRWVYFLGHAIIDAPTPGTTPGHEPVITMAPPRRFPCRQLAQRTTVRCDGRVATCDQTNSEYADLTAAWRAQQQLRQAHQRGEYPGACAGCVQWHRP